MTEAVFKVLGMRVLIFLLKSQDCSYSTGNRVTLESWALLGSSQASPMLTVTVRQCSSVQVTMTVLTSIWAFTTAQLFRRKSSL